MSQTLSNTNALNEQKRVFRQAQQHLRIRRFTASDRFKKSLLIASNVIQSSRMLQNLENLVQLKRAEQDVDVDHLEEQLVQVHDSFQTALRDYSEEDIFNAESQIEHLTLFYDPVYLEGEEALKREYFEQQKKLRQRVTKVSWASNPSSRFVSLLKGDIEGVEEVTEEEQRSCISKCAWSFAIIGMVIAIAFLIVDFWQAQANPALSTTLTQNEKLTLPIIYGCLTFPLIPTFETLPNEQYKGFALWGLRSFTNVDTNHTLLFPKTKLITESTFLGRPEYCSQALQYLSKQSIIDARSDSFDPRKQCYSCLKIGGKTPMALSRKAATQRPSGAITLEFAASMDLEYCFNPLFGDNRALSKNLKETIKAHGQELVSRGIVNLISGTIEFAVDFGFEDFETAFPGDDAAEHSAVATVLCNLYFFSGYFFPVKPGTEVRYSFDMHGGIESWKPIGKSSNFLSVVAEPRFATRYVNRSMILAEMSSDGDGTKAIAQTTVNIYSVNGPREHPNSLQDFAVSLRPNHRDVLFFTKSTEHEESRHSSVVQFGAQRIFQAIGRFIRYNISLDFATFETEHMTRRPTTSTAEFLTDIFEYVGLFTGICAYSVLVGPARMYLKNLNKRHQPDASK